MATKAPRTKAHGVTLIISEDALREADFRLNGRLTQLAEDTAEMVNRIFDEHIRPTLGKRYRFDIEGAEDEQSNAE